MALILRCKIRIRSRSNMSLQKLFLTSLFCFLGFFVMAQDEDLPEDWASDPLKKPEIWQALKKEPTNATLWKKYMD